MLGLMPNPPYPQLKGADMGRFWKVLKITIWTIIGLLFLVTAMNAVTFEWAIMCTSMFGLMFCQVMWEVCE
jgi:multisubunit Na+/H+ antiporter MnhB subunit